MAISFRNIPPNLRVPLAYFEFDPSLAGTATSLQKALLLGTVPPIGPGVTLPPNTLTEVFSADQVRALAGTGSALGRQAEAWFRNNASVPLSIIAAEETGFTAGEGSIEWTGPAVGGGVIPLYIGGRIVRIVVSAGDDDIAISVAAADAINADARVAVSAEVSTINRARTEITAAQAGSLGNLKIQLALAGAVGGEIMPEGVGATITQMGDDADHPAGAGVPDVAALLALLGDAPFDFVLCPWTDASSLNALQEFFNDTSGRWSWAMQLYGHGWCAVEGTVGELSALGNTRNDQHVSIMGFSNSPTPADEWMAAYAGQSAGSLIIDPARPVQALPLIGVRPPPREDRFTILQRQVLYFDGISATYVTDGEEVYTDRVITTYRRNVWGAPDDSYLDVETLYTAQYYARSARNRILIKFPRHKLASDGTRFGAGQAIVTPKIARAELIAHYGELEEIGIVEDLDGFERALIVERSATDPNRLNALVSPSFVNQLRIFAVLVQFRLHGSERIVA
jgi:phage tail sheath gpL-like